ncbi:MAG: RcnB family protein [Asticcacaulis sp.]
MKRIVTASLIGLMAGSFVMADAAQAQPHRYERDRYERHDDRHDRRDNRRYYRDGYRDGWRDNSNWRRGGYVGYRDWDRGRYVDYHSHRGLYAPPRGYEWRRVDDRYVLAAVATGLIAAIVLSR